MTDTTQSPPTPELLEVTRADVFDALRGGLADFRKAPAFGLFFGAVFTAIGIVIFLQMFVWGTTYWVLPLAAGFPLIGPFAAVGLYEVSRRIEAGERLDWHEVLTVVAGERKRQIPSMAFVVLFFFLVWVYLAHLVFALTFGLKPLTNVLSSYDFLFSAEGITMLAIGSAVGAVLAFLLFAVSAVSIPMFLDREIDVVSGMIASFQSVTGNLGAMLTWAAIIAVASVAAMVPLFLGMLFVFPVLGHASWHLYRKAVEPPPPEARRR